MYAAWDRGSLERQGEQFGLVEMNPQKMPALRQSLGIPPGQAVRKRVAAHLVGLLEGVARDPKPSFVEQLGLDPACTRIL